LQLTSYWSSISSMTLLNLILQADSWLYCFHLLRFISLSLILMVRQENTINAQSFHTKGHTTCEAPRIPETISTRWSRQYMMKWWALINDKTQRNDWKGQVDVDVTVPTLLVKTFFAQLKRSSYQLKVTLKMEKQRVVVEIIRQWAYHPHYRHR